MRKHPLKEREIAVATDTGRLLAGSEDGNAMSLSGVEEAPVDGAQYARRDGAWIPVEGIIEGSENGNAFEAPLILDDVEITAVQETIDGLSKYLKRTALSAVLVSILV